MVVIAKYGWHTVEGNNRLGWFLFDCEDSWHTVYFENEDVLDWADLPDRFLERWMRGEEIARPQWQKGTPPEHGSYLVRSNFFEVTGSVIKV